LAAARLAALAGTASAPIPLTFLFSSHGNGQPGPVGTFARAIGLPIHNADMTALYHTPRHNH
jgi:hypothetical protein